MTAPLQWTTPARFVFVINELVSASLHVDTNDSTVTYKIISGRLPQGLTLDSQGIISGTPIAVLDTTRSIFVVRATSETAVRDRTFYIDVVGADSPIWQSAAGYLPAGLHDQKYIITGQWVDYTVNAITYQAPPNTKITYRVSAGELPEGLSLSTSGRIFGIPREQSDADFRLHHLPKIYDFTITASDGAAASTRNFRLLIINPAMLRADATILPIDISLLDLDIIPTSISYLQPLQWIHGFDLGVVDTNNNVDLPIVAYDPAPERGPVSYIYTPGDSILTQLPLGLDFDQVTGYIYGNVDYQPQYTQKYSLNVTAVKTDTESGLSVSTTGTFRVTVLGVEDSGIVWATEYDLGVIESGTTSNLSLLATEINSSYDITYHIVDGLLPPGLSLTLDGNITGAIEYNAAGVYSFTVRAQDVYQQGAVDRTFTLRAVSNTDNQDTQIYVRPFLSTTKRAAYQKFITNEFTFDPSLIYRQSDPAFGVQHDIKMMLEFGITQLNLADYMPALEENFYRRRFTFGDVKVAVAKDEHGTVLYEAVYVDIVDDQINNDGVSVSQVVYANDDVYYPASITNMRNRLQSLMLSDNTVIGVDEYKNPLFMRTPQKGSYTPVDYLRIVPICYALPGQGARIASRIKISKFDFKQLDFEVDRLVVKNSRDHADEKYLMFERQSITTSLESDQYLFGPDQVRLDIQDDTPIIRE